jgi:hypothetical protein
LPTRTRVLLQLVQTVRTGTDNQPIMAQGPGAIDYGTLDAVPAVIRRNRASTVEALAQSGVDKYDIPAFLARCTELEKGWGGGSTIGGADVANYSLDQDRQQIVEVRHHTEGVEPEAHVGAPFAHLRHFVGQHEDRDET